MTWLTYISEKETEDSIKHTLQAEITQKNEGEVTGDIGKIEDITGVHMFY